MLRDNFQYIIYYNVKELSYKIGFYFYYLYIKLVLKKQ